MSNYIKKSDIPPLELEFVEIRRPTGPHSWNLYQAIFHNRKDAREWIDSFGIKLYSEACHGGSIKGGYYTYLEERIPSKGEEYEFLSRMG